MGGMSLAASGRARWGWVRMGVWTALLWAGLALAQGAGVRVERTSPAEQTARPGATVTHVFALYGEGEVRPELRSQHRWPLLTSPRTLTLKGAEPVYFPVTLRVPEDALAGTRDRLTVEVNGARAEATTAVAYAPGLEVTWTREVDYLPPLSHAQLELQNTGNGADVALVRLETLEGVPVFSARVALEPGERASLRIPITQYGTYHLRVRLEHGNLERTGLLATRIALRHPDDPFRLVGRVGVIYSWPNRFSGSVGLSGPLSDFAHLQFGAGYALGSIPAGAASVTFEGGYFSVAFGPSYGLALGLAEKNVATSLAISGPVPRGSFTLDLTNPPINFGVSAVLDSDPSFRAQGRVGLNRGRSPDSGRGDALRAELQFMPQRPELTGALNYATRWRDAAVEAGASFDWKPGAPALFGTTLDVSPRTFSAGAAIHWTSVGLADWSAALASNSERLELDTPVPIAAGLHASQDRFRAFATATLDLPAPWSDLQGGAEARYEKGAWSLSLYGGSQFSQRDGLTLWNTDLRLGWPLSENELSLGFRAGGSYLRTRADLTWAPWKPSFDTALSLQAPIAGAWLDARLGHEWYAGQTRFSLSATAPISLNVPEAVSRTFGGRRVGWIEGRVEVEGAPELRADLVVRAGGRTVHTDAQGRFRIALPPGDYTVELVTEELPATVVAVDARKEVTVQLKKTSAVLLKAAARSVLEGRVRVEAEGTVPPPQRFVVQVENPQGRATTLYTETDGSFRLAGLPPGTYTVTLPRAWLPQGWAPAKDRATVRLRAGEAAYVELVVRAPERRVFAGAALRILTATPEAERVPPGAAPRITVQVEGEPERVLVRMEQRVVGLLLPKGDGTWEGRIHLPDDAAGTLVLQVVAEAGDQEARFPIFLNVDPQAPWGVVRTTPVAVPGSELPVWVHWYAPVHACWIEAANGDRIELSQSEGGWSGRFRLPEDASGRYALRIVAELENGETVSVRQWILIRKK